MMNAHTTASVLGGVAIAIGGMVVIGRGDDRLESDPRRAPSYPDHTRLMVVRDGEGHERPVRGRGDWDVRRAHILAHFQEVAGPLPGGERRVPLDVQVLSTEKEPGFVRKKISFAVEPGDRVPAWLLIPIGTASAEAGTKHRHPAVLCLHQTVAIGKDESVGLGGKPDLRYAMELARRGYVAIAPDYPGFGEYKIDVYKLGYASATMKAIWNNLRAVDVLCGLDEVDAGCIGVIGHSLGGHNAIFTALFEPRIRAVVSSCGFNAFPFYYKGNIAGWSHKGYMPRLRERYGLDLAKVPFDFPELMGALAPRAFFTNSPLHDANFEVEGVRVALDAARPVYQLLGAPDCLAAAYPDDQHTFPQAVRERAYEFLDRQLRGSGELEKGR
jgi:pimeloyl-ACP methyl ester carboxylesterase